VNFMSDYPVISGVSQTLKTLLVSNITNSSDNQIKNVPIELLSPKEMQDANEDLGVSVWLYRVSRMPEMLNEPPERKGANQLASVPLPVLLYYLVTPVAKDPLTRHALMGKVLQVFNDHSILRGADLQGVLQGTQEQLRVNLETVSLEDLSLVWDALSEPYQLSVSYMVQVVKIDSDREPVKASPVMQKESTYTQILSVV
jgi:Pvc16 N-terminal domain